MLTARRPTKLELGALMMARATCPASATASAPSTKLAARASGAGQNRKPSTRSHCIVPSSRLQLRSLLTQHHPIQHPARAIASSIARRAEGCSTCPYSSFSRNTVGRRRNTRCRPRHSGRRRPGRYRESTKQQIASSLAVAKVVVHCQDAIDAFPAGPPQIGSYESTNRCILTCPR